MRTLLLSTLAALALGFAPAPFPRSSREVDPDKADLARLQGVWQEVRYQLGTDDRLGDGTRVTVAGSRVTYRRGESLLSDWTITLDTQHRPKRMQFRHFPGKGEPSESIYRLDGDTLTLCYPVAGSNLIRPGEFSPQSGHALVTFLRVR
jgi:uncharacterized protein (TIGR03067 family)